MDTMQKQKGVQKKRKQRRKYSGWMFGLAGFGSLLCVALCYFFFIGRYDELKGTWMVDAVTIYHFNGKGEGGLLLPSSEYGFHYEIQKNMVKIDFEDDSAVDVEYQFKVNHNQLQLINREEGTQAEIFILQKMEK